MLPGCTVYFDWLKFGKPEFQCKRQTDPYIAWFLFWKNQLRCGILPLWTNEQIKRMLTNCTDITIALDAYGMPLNSSRNALNDWPSKQSYCWSIWCCKKISWSMLEKLFEKKDMLGKKIVKSWLWDIDSVPFDNQPIQKKVFMTQIKLFSLDKEELVWHLNTSRKMGKKTWLADLAAKSTASMTLPVVLQSRQSFWKL